MYFLEPKENDNTWAIPYKNSEPKQVIIFSTHALLLASSVLTQNEIKK
jgi:hypothetical protein